MAKIKGKHCTEDDKPISIKNVCGSRIWQYQVKTKQAESQDEEISHQAYFLGTLTIMHLMKLF